MFDCVDHGIILSELKFCGINGKNLALHKIYLHNRYVRTAIYNGSDRRDIFSAWGTDRSGAP